MWIDLSQHMFLAPGHASAREAEQSAHPTRESQTAEVRQLICGQLRKFRRTSTLTIARSRVSDAKDPAAGRNRPKPAVRTRRLRWR